MASHPFRFGVVAALPPQNQTWAEQARSLETAGYSSLLVPDTLNTYATFPALAAAAAVTSTLRLGTYVLAVPNHRPARIAHEAVTLDAMSGGRLELGLGVGRPDAAREADALGVAFGSGAERLSLLRETIQAVLDRCAASAGPLRPVQLPHPPIMLAGAGAKLLRLAAQHADIVAFGMPAPSTEDDLAAKSAELREYAGARFDDLELAFNITVVGGEPAPWLKHVIGMDPLELLKNGAATAVDGTPRQMADTLLARRERTGVSYVQVSAMFAEKFAPVVDLLAGR
ncbi:MAG: TIGR03621 family F420-dependent LLM class oxidoreductase [Actinocrinis sp.]